MQQARIKGAWLPSEIFQKNGNAAERKKTIVNRLRRAIKRGKFSRAAWVFWSGGWGCVLGFKFL